MTGNGTIKALRTHRLVGSEALAVEDIDTPVPGPGEVLVGLEASAVNLMDAVAIMGGRKPPPPVPFVPGLEGAGMVLAVGPDVKGLSAGDRICAWFPKGSLAQQAIAPANLAVPLPKRISSQAAAPLPMAYAGALMALRDRAHLSEGETLLVLGVGGHAGLAAVTIGKLLGARVIAAASGEDRAMGASQYGADDVVDTSAKPLSESVKTLTDGKGANVVFDPVGGDAFTAAIATLAQGGRYLIAGFAGGQPREINPGLLFGRDAQLIAANTLTTISTNPIRALAALAQVVTWASEDKIAPKTAAQFALKDARHAIEYVRAHRANGAVIVTFGS